MKLSTPRCCAFWAAGATGGKLLISALSCRTVISRPPTFAATCPVGALGARLHALTARTSVKRNKWSGLSLKVIPFFWGYCEYATIIWSTEDKLQVKRLSLLD